MPVEAPQWPRHGFAQCRPAFLNDFCYPGAIALSSPRMGVHSGIAMNPVAEQGPLTPEQQRWLEDFLVRFEQSWRDGLLSAWTVSLPPAGSPLHRITLLALTRIDLALQWRNGRRAVVEAYLQQFPELGTTETVAFQL